MEMIIYSLKVAAILIAFYLLYKWVMSRETHHSANRFLLLGSAALAFVLPLCSISMHTSSFNPTVAISQAVVGLEEVIVGANSGGSSFHWMPIAISLFYIGVVFCVVRIVMSIVTVLKIVGLGTKQHLPNGIMLVVVDGEQAPFSWFCYIIISRKDYEENAAEILTHEQAHISHRHSIDVLLCDLMCCLQWFNPAMWLLRRELCAVHEYEADKAVLDSGINAKQYQLLLIKKAAGAKWYSIANSFNHSKLKYRITMMSRRKSSRWTLAKALYVLPIAAFAMVAFAQISCSENQDEDSENTNSAATSPEDLTDAKAIEVKDGKIYKSPEDEPFLVVEDMPEFPGGGDEALREYLAKSVKYPENAIKRGVEGRVFVSFVISKEGYVTDVKVAKEVDSDLDAEAVRVVSEMPQWTPGKQKGIAVNVSYTVPINFKLN
ncbi:MAG: M56 family metallopeptidase [Bacteroidales bacterium]|nr:M56 family metallopeptidase [Bacteroidales bacterium]